MAPDPPQRLRSANEFVISHTPLKRLFGYARPYRVRLMWAVAGMLVYAVGTGGLAALIKPVFDSGLVRQERVALIAWSLVGAYLLKGRRLLCVVDADGRRRTARRDGLAQRHSTGTFSVSRPASSPRRTTGQLMSRTQ